MQIKISQFAHHELATLSLLAAVAMRMVYADPIYHCVRDGHLTLTDQPCDGAARTGPTDTTSKSPLAGPPTAPEGAWHGAAQLTATLAGKPLALSPQTSQISLLISPDGSITGGLRDQACDLKGQLGDKYDAGDRAIRFETTGCHQKDLNLSFSGTLQLAPSGRPSRLAVSGLSGFIAGKNPVAASIRADLSRDSAPPR